MATGSKEVQVQVVDRVAKIIIAHPPLNILTIRIMREIAAKVAQIGDMREVCAIVLAASPVARAFSAGVSVEEHRPETVFQMLEAFHSIFRALNTASKPVVALVTGNALGGGCELVAFCDIVIATHSARFGQPEIKLGVFPPVSACILPRVVGDKKAREMILTGELLTADEALAVGLVNYVVPEAELDAKAAEVLALLRQMSVPALETARRAMVESAGLAFDEALKRSETIYLNQLMSFKDPLEGIQAFVDRRSPNWKHR